MEVGPQFRARTQTAGQQGLFPAAPHMRDAARYPRGYNPKRQADVMGALRHGTDSPVIRPIHEGIEGLYEPEHHGPAKQENALHERGVIDAVARSTIPAAHLRERPEGPYQNQEHQARIGTVEVHPRWARQESASGMFFEHGQQYAEGAAKLLPYRSIVLGNSFGEHRDTNPQTSMRKDDDVAETLVHELGHHHSAAHEDWEAYLDRQEYDYNSGTHPAEEGFADNYADKHFRPDPRRKRPLPYSSNYTRLIGHNPEYRAQRPPEEIQSPSDREALTPGARGRRVAAARAKSAVAASPQWEQAGLF